jgi:hypothetical protein
VPLLKFMTSFKINIVTCMYTCKNH